MWEHRGPTVLSEVCPCCLFSMGYFNPSLITVPSSVTPGSISSCDAFLNVFQSKGLRQEVICPCASSPEALTVAIRRYCPMIAEDSLGAVTVQYWKAAVLAVNLSEGSRAGPAFPRCWHGIFPSLGSPAGDTPHWHVANPPEGKRRGTLDVLSCRLLTVSSARVRLRSSLGLASVG